jgi:hypothetical protein
MSVEETMLVQALTDAVLALYGIPVPPASTPIEDVIAALRHEAQIVRDTGRPAAPWRFDYWTS